MGTSNFSNVTIYWNGTLLSEHARGSNTSTKMALPVATTAKGFAGMIIGSQKSTASVMSAEPADNLWLHIGSVMSNLDQGEIMIVGSLRTIKSNGLISQNNFQSAIEHNSPLCFMFEGRGWSTS